MENVKLCATCAVEKPITEFYKRADSNSTRSQCKKCWGQARSAYTKANTSKLAYLHKMKNIERKYGITRAQYEEMLSQQNYKCKSCHRQLNGVRGPLSPCVDHCHKTSKVRGILCKNCNHALGHVNDDIDRLLKLIEYLKWQA